MEIHMPLDYWLDNQSLRPKTTKGYGGDPSECACYRATPFTRLPTPN
jgi:hypothetical protein